jgi:hypothetical protein
MREKLNSNPVFQIAVIGVLLAAAGFFLLTKSGGGGEAGGEEVGATEATVSVAGTPATGSATAATPGAAVEEAVEGALEAAASGAAAAPIPTAMPVPPPPAPVSAAYESDKTVVLLVVRKSGIDDRLVVRAAEQLGAEPGVAAFVVPAHQIARYAAITLGVDVQQVPALVVMRPRRLSEGTPQATVKYGFQTAQGVVQAVRDASYAGPEVTYHPE